MWLLFVAVFGVAASDMHRCLDDRGEFWSPQPCPAGQEHPDRGGAGAELRPVIDPDELLRAHRIDAQMACEQAIERLARYDWRWLSRGWTGSRFARTTVNERGQLILVGDQIEFQNGFGVFIRHRYACQYDPGGDAPLATAEPGRL